MIPDHREQLGVKLGVVGVRRQSSDHKGRKLFPPSSSHANNSVVGKDGTSSDSFQSAGTVQKTEHLSQTAVTEPSFPGVAVSRPSLNNQHNSRPQVMEHQLLAVSISSKEQSKDEINRALEVRVIHNTSSEWQQIKEATEKKAREAATISQNDEVGEVTCFELLEALELSRCFVFNELCTWCRANSTLSVQTITRNLSRHLSKDKGAFQAVQSDDSRSRKGQPIILDEDDGDDSNDPHVLEKTEKQSS
ncbi:hypothetical protein KIW84_052959 [Lathyrus oleraceus]|uniref:Uncharacterized protein n=1 Tax=Pisum sativum TaxID=3888 RepID=A0A9D4WRT9_PEA|nr:hypothetical protein KIW84_052959 [Pisum sativum]